LNHKALPAAEEGWVICWGFIASTRAHSAGRRKAHFSVAQAANLCDDGRHYPASL
jgi:thymidylate kinase